MNLKEIFDQLTYGELYHLAVGGASGTGISERDYPMVISHLNLGLKTIYTRLPMKLDQVIVNQYDQIQTYILDPRFARTNTESKESIKYIHDSEYKPFLGGVLQILSIHNEIGEELYLNDKEEHWSVHLLSPNTIQVPYPAKENAMVCVYQAAPDRIIIDEDGPEKTSIDIPEGILEPLLYFVAGRIYSSQNFDGATAEGNNWTAKFENSIARIRQAGLYNQENNTRRKLENDGWV